MRLRSAGDDVTNVTSQRRVSGGRWSADRSDRDVSVLTIVNATVRDAGLIVCHYVTSVGQAAFHVFRLIVTDDQPLAEGSRRICISVSRF